MRTRKIAKLITVQEHPGFLGKGHWAAAVIDGHDFSQTDPFFLLMDDYLDLPGGPPAGGPHPHAGFETVTLVIAGNEKEWKTGSLELLTAGKGVIHSEEITSATKMRILQLWLVLPPEQRWADPLWQQLLAEEAPTLKTTQFEVTVYSGSSNGLRSPLQQHTPFTLLDFRLTAGAEITQELPAAYNGFLYMLEGEAAVGDTRIAKGQVAWFDRQEAESQVVVKAGEAGARFVLYAAKPHQVPIVSHGPFIGDTDADIPRLYQEYRQGKMPHVNDLPENRKLKYQLMV